MDHSSGVEPSTLKIFSRIWNRIAGVENLRGVLSCFRVGRGFLSQFSFPDSTLSKSFHARLSFLLLLGEFVSRGYVFTCIVPRRKLVDTT